MLRDEVGVLAEAIARPFDLDDDGVVEKAVEQCGRDDRIPEHRGIPLFLMRSSLTLSLSIPTMRLWASGFRSCRCDLHAGRLFSSLALPMAGVARFADRQPILPRTQRLPHCQR